MGQQYGQNVSQVAITATATATTTLINTSKTVQIFTGTNPQTVVFPDATTMAVGQSFSVYNQSTSSLTLQFNGGGSFTDAGGTTYGTLPAGSPLLVILQTNVTSAGTWAVVATVAAAATPTSTMLPFAGTSAPAGFLLCDGSAVSRTTFSVLFAAISTTYGVGDGSTTFNIPNTQGVFLRGAGSQTITAITYTGTRGTTQGDQLQGHKHAATSTDSGHTHQEQSGTTASGSNLSMRGDVTTGPTAPRADFTLSSTANITTTVNNPTTDGTNGTPRTGTETHPANISVNYIIKT